MMQSQGSLSVDRMCLLAGLSRATFYRLLRRQDRPMADQELRHSIQKICLRHRRYGYRRVRRHLKRDGMAVGDRRLLRLMREDNLLAIRKKGYVNPPSSQTTAAFPNLLLQLKATGPDQVWVADITYIRLQKEFVFLAVVLDRYTRRVVGWHLDRKMDISLTLAALRQALLARQPRPGLIHHSDRGIQYACQTYCRELMDHKILGSMSAAGNPYDNAVCESFMSTLKKEEIYCREYENLEQLRQSLEDFIERYYNRVRMHSALGYRAPAEYEAEIMATSA